MDLSWMTLGDLIDHLESMDPGQPTPRGLTDPHSHRADYHELAFDVSGPSTVGEMLHVARAAVGNHEGYKGGTFAMDRNTGVAIARWGQCGCSLSRFTLDLMTNRLPAASVVEWIPFAEAMPKPGQDVVATGGGEVWIDTLSDGYWETASYTPCEPTHWIPLPDPPAQIEGDKTPQQ